jgi:hypothetical protein
MKTKQVLILPVLLLALTFGASGQRLGRFIVNMVSFGSVNNTLCLGTVITQSHVLAPASCVNGVDRLGIYMEDAGAAARFGKKRKISNEF